MIENNPSYLSLRINFLNGKMRQLPFMNGIKAFEATARHGSLAKAAEELHVTPAAVSRMVRLLEQRLDVALFHRSANRLVPTPAGQLYQAGLTRLFDQLVDLTDRVTRLAERRVLTVGAGPTFATRWLIPRLGVFREVAPEVEVRITTGGVAAPFGDDWSCGITLGDGTWPGLDAEPLFDADLIPVCTPSLARDLNGLADLKAVDLLRVSHAPDDWSSWLGAAGGSRIAAVGPMFEYYGQALQAALDGLGVAMGIRPYIDDDLRAGRLVAPFTRSVPKGKRWFLVYRRQRADDSAFVAFRRWIRGEIGKTEI